MVTQPSTCLRLRYNTAGAITWWRRLPEKFCRNPIGLESDFSPNPEIESYNSVSHPLSHVHCFIPHQTSRFRQYIFHNILLQFLAITPLYLLWSSVFHFIYTVLFDSGSCGILSLLNYQLSAAGLSSLSYNFKTSFTDATKAQYRLLAIHFMHYEYSLNANSSRL